MHKKHNPSGQISDPETRKQELLEELDQTRKQIEGSIQEIQSMVTSRTRMRYWINKYPLQLFGTALLAGFVLAGSSCRVIKRVKDEDDAAERLVKSSEKSWKKRKKSLGKQFGDMLGDELKKMAVKKTVRLIVRSVEDALDEKKEDQE